MKYVLIGCGRIAVNHIKAVLNNHLELAAVCDVKPEAMETLLAKHGLEKDTSIRRYTDYREMIEAEQPTLAAIATESGIHAEIALYCIAHGVNVIIEKPMAMSMADADAIVEAKHKVKTCPVCQNLTDQDLCPICADPRRDHSVICVVAEPRDLIALERAREYQGLYHVLHGVSSPLNHIGPDDIRIRELLARVADGDVQEVIMATNPDTEGEATAMYISSHLRPKEIKVTRLAYGVADGSQLE